jgi:hypothetical protein
MEQAMPDYSTTDMYLIFENDDTGNIVFHEINAFAEAGAPIDPDTGKSFSVIGWSTNQRATTPNTSKMFLVYLDDAGLEYYQPWEDAEVGPMVDEDTGEDMELVGWTKRVPS